jgi:hypothetical protein
LSTAVAANSRPQAPWKPIGGLGITIKGAGSVRLSWGFFGHKVLYCAGGTCQWGGASFHRRRVVLTAKPHSGWKLARWQGLCKGRRPKCTIDFSHRSVHPECGCYGGPVTVSFRAVGPGVTRGNPIRIGHAAYIGSGWRLRINSFTPSVQLSPPPPAGAEYVAANMTVTFCPKAAGCTDVAGSTWPVPSDYFYVIGSHGVAYRPGDCPGDAPPPALVDSVRLSPGQSATGNVCWQVATKDASTLELHTDPRFLYYAALWFALH